MRLAKVDCDEYGSVKDDYGVQGFPTLLFFHKGKPTRYNGRRSIGYMVNWLNEQTMPAS